MKYIPLDKSWIIRMGILDLIHGYEDIISFLDAQPVLSDDLSALRHACSVWRSHQPIRVWESGTLYRFLLFVSWRLQLQKEFILEGTLKWRLITQDSSIIYLSQQQLLELPREPTTQWASAKALLGDQCRLESPPYKLQVTYQAIDHWHTQRAKGETWEGREDDTIRNQAETFLKLYRSESASFEATQAEDYCFARIFNFITQLEGKLLWPNLAIHETNRLEEMERIIDRIFSTGIVDSLDHRVIQAAVMWGLVHKVNIRVDNPSAVAKSWPEFWDFIGSISESGKGNQE